MGNEIKVNISQKKNPLRTLLPVQETSELSKNLKYAKKKKKETHIPTDTM